MQPSHILDPVNPTGHVAVAIGGSPELRLRVFFIPFFAPSHIISMTDLAIVFAGRHGVQPTMVVTPANTALIEPSVRRAAAVGRHVSILTYPFPVAAGLPAGKENLSSVSDADSWRIYEAVDLSRVAHEDLLFRHRPDAIVADIPFHWTTSIADDLCVPRITYHGAGVFPQCVMNLLHAHRPHDAVAGDYEPFSVTNLPGPPVQLVRSEIPCFLQTTDFLTNLFDLLKKAQKESYGVVVNTFYNLEKDYCDFYRDTDCRQAWFVGPVSEALPYDTVPERGGAAGRNAEICMRWLETQPQESVVFVCFGSWFNFSEAQLREIALGLENSGERFLWVVRSGVGGSAGEDWLPEGWEKRVENRGLLVRGWAPQTAVLGHVAIGAFMSHCGWNSLLEAVAAGVPVLTWPLAFEQFINERLAVNVLGFGARVWSGRRSSFAEQNPVVPAEAVAAAMKIFMGGSKEAKTARAKARELAALAKAAVTPGGSSDKDLNDLIDKLMEIRSRRK